MLTRIPILQYSSINWLTLTETGSLWGSGCCLDVFSHQSSCVKHYQPQLPCQRQQKERSSGCGRLCRGGQRPVLNIAKSPDRDSSALKTWQLISCGLIRFRTSQCRRLSGGVCEDNILHAHRMFYHLVFSSGTLCPCLIFWFEFFFIVTEGGPLSVTQWELRCLIPVFLVICGF